MLSDAYLLIYLTLGEYFFQSNVKLAHIIFTEPIMIPTDTL
jgi:hypothetical protein